jgi:hypothetical protein
MASIALNAFLKLWVRIPPEAWIFVCCECCVLSCRGLCNELITRPEESYRLWCVVVCDLETSRMTKATKRVGSQRHKKVIINTMSFWTCITLHSLVLQEQTTMFLHSFPPVLKTYGLNCTKCFLQVCTHSNQKRFILPSVWIQVNTRQVAYRKEVLQVASAKGVRQNKRGQTRKGAFDPVR